MIAVLTAMPRPFSLVDGLLRRTYAAAGSVDGKVVHGRGMQLDVALTNTAEEAVELLSLEVIATRRADYPPHLRYDKIETDVGPCRLPLEGPEHHVTLRESNMDGYPVAVQGVRGPIAPGTQTWGITIEAGVSGLWTCDIHARCRDLRATAGPFLILLRGR
jgi:hypothetical protein